MLMEYKKLEKLAKQGDYGAIAQLEKRKEVLVQLPLREAMGYPLTWCPTDIQSKK